jgi:hypothetical protein
VTRSVPTIRRKGLIRRSPQSPAVFALVLASCLDQKKEWVKIASRTSDLLIDPCQEDALTFHISSLSASMPTKACSFCVFIAFVRPPTVSLFGMSTRKGLSDLLRIQHQSLNLSSEPMFERVLLVRLLIAYRSLIDQTDWNPQTKLKRLWLGLNKKEETRARGVARKNQLKADSRSGVCRSCTTNLIS